MCELGRIVRDSEFGATDILARKMAHPEEDYTAVGVLLANCHKRITCTIALNVEQGTKTAVNKFVKTAKDEWGLDFSGFFWLGGTTAKGATAVHRVTVKLLEWLPFSPEFLTLPKPGVDLDLLCKSVGYKLFFEDTWMQQSFSAQFGDPMRQGFASCVMRTKLKLLADCQTKILKKEDYVLDTFFFRELTEDLEAEQKKEWVLTNEEAAKHLISELFSDFRAFFIALVNSRQLWCEQKEEGHDAEEDEASRIWTFNPDQSDERKLVQRFHWRTLELMALRNGDKDESGKPKEWGKTPGPFFSWHTAAILAAPVAMLTLTPKVQNWLKDLTLSPSVHSFSIKGSKEVPFA